MPLELAAAFANAALIPRIVFAPIVLPVGIMLSVIGGPFFMYLLLKNRGGVGH